MLRSLYSLGFLATRQALLTLNTFYVGVGCLLVLISVYAQSVMRLSPSGVLGGVILAGIFLILVALLGIYGTRRQHQAALFFYMVILSVVLVVQFIVAIVCLSDVSDERIEKVAEVGWSHSTKETKYATEKALGCCGLKRLEDSPNNCKRMACWPLCGPCLPEIVDVASSNLTRVGLLSLLFSFTEMLPDLSPHLHTRECNFIIQLLQQCHQENPMGKMVGKCSYWDEAVWQCTKKERIWRRDNNPSYTKRVVELRNLPESHWTPALQKLKEDGMMPDLAQQDNGCKL